MAVISTAVCSDFDFNSSLRLIKFFFTKKKRYFYESSSTLESSKTLNQHKII